MASWPTATPGDGVVKRGADGALDAVGAAMNYQERGVSLVRTRRDAGGSDAALEGARWTATNVLIRNGRRAGLTLDRQGFALTGDATSRTDDPLPAGLDLYREADVVGPYYAHCERLVRRACEGAKTVVAFDHNVRSEAGRAASRKLIGGNAVQAANRTRPRRPTASHPGQCGRPPHRHSRHIFSPPLPRRAPRRSFTETTPP